MLTMGSLFSGSGGFELAARQSGIKPVWASEIAPFPIRVTTKRFPDMIHLGDIHGIDGGKITPVDIIAFGSPCTDVSSASSRRTGLHGKQSSLFFEAIRVVSEKREATAGRYPRYAVWENVCFAAGTLVTCEDGYKPIETVKVGERVKTRSGEYHVVARKTKTKRQPVLRLTLSGSEDLVATHNHPFYTRRKLYGVRNGKSYSEPEWTRADALTKRHMVGYRLDKPVLPDNFLTDAEAWALGRWLADGSLDLTGANPHIYISVGINKAAKARERLRLLPYIVRENRPHPTAVNFCFTSREFYGLIESAGRGAGYKRVPPFVFGMTTRLQGVVLDGYMSGDGYSRSRHVGTEYACATASRELAYGIARLMRNCFHVGVSMSVGWMKNKYYRTIQPADACIVDRRAGRLDRRFAGRQGDPAGRVRLHARRGRSDRG